MNWCHDINFPREENQSLKNELDESILGQSNLKHELGVKESQLKVLQQQLKLMKKEITKLNALKKR